MIQEFIKSLLLIFMAEMGDKTQILAMMFATRYKVSKVLIGVFIGAALNHGFAILLGSYIGKFISVNVLGMIAGAAFLVFAFWTLKPDDEEEETNLGDDKGAIVTVATAFFVGELGDKTQLTAITLSVDSLFPLLVLAGTVSGMVLTSGIGIIIGNKIGGKIPESFIKMVSATIFFVFGSIKVISMIPTGAISVFINTAIVVTVGGFIYALWRFIIRNKENEEFQSIKTWIRRNS